MSNNISYEDYVKILSSEIEKSSERGLSVMKVTKNNNTMLDAVVLEGMNIAPVAYIHDFYEAFKSGKAIHEIIEDIMLIVSNVPESVKEIVAKMDDYKEASKYILPAIINYEKNQEYLKKVVHRRFLDLAVVYKIAFDVDDGVRGVLTIPNFELEQWCVTEEELYKKAIENARKKDEFSAVPIMELCYDILSHNGVHTEEEARLYEASKDTSDKNFIVLSSDSRQGGASVLLFTDIFKNALEKYYPDSKKLLILPSSIQEVIAMPYPDDEESIKFLKEMVREVNETVVAEEEVLSDDSLYFYDVETDKIGIVEMLKEDI
ncbi:MAG: hypothetical protein E7261_06405 [Lachnospiraceae bacterium]|nr:hypothetical protein [Lachnospiraceae bacterium]